MIDTLKEAQKKGGKNRWEGISEEERSKQMRKVALKRWGKKKITTQKKKIVA